MLLFNWSILSGSLWLIHFIFHWIGFTVPQTGNKTCQVKWWMLKETVRSCFIINGISGITTGVDLHPLKPPFGKACWSSLGLVGSWNRSRLCSGFWVQFELLKDPNSNHILLHGLLLKQQACSVTHRIAYSLIVWFGIRQLLLCMCNHMRYSKLDVTLDSSDENPFQRPCRGYINSPRRTQMPLITSNGREPA